MIFCRNAPRQVVIPHRASVALRLGVPICGPYLCVCGENIDQIMVFMVCRGRRSAGRHSRHSAVNDLIKRALAVAKIPSRLEPSCLSRNDVKRPDGLTLVPWSHGRCLVWDFTCPDTLAINHLHQALLPAQSPLTPRTNEIHSNPGSWFIPRQRHIGRHDSSSSSCPPQPLQPRPS